MKPQLMNVISSPSNVVFLIIAATLCTGFFLQIVSQENFIYIAGQVFAYYFGRSQAKAQIASALMAPPPTNDQLEAQLPKEG